MNSDRMAAWIPCPCCECYLCTIHGMHVHDCPCPPIEEWEESPYGPATSPGPSRVQDGDLRGIQKNSRGTS